MEVEHVAINRQLAAGETMPQSHIEGGTLIVPVVEENLVVEKRLVITEELHIRVLNEEEPATHTVPIRRQRAVVEHLRPTKPGQPV